MMLVEKLTSAGDTIRGIQGLADFLGCSFPTAHKLKASGKIPYYEHKRLLFFKGGEVLAALKKGGKQNG
jgi:hypothetical protein